MRVEEIKAAIEELPGAGLCRDQEVGCREGLANLGARVRGGLEGGEAGFSF